MFERAVDCRASDARSAPCRLSSPGPPARHVAPWPPSVQRAPRTGHSSRNTGISAPMPARRSRAPLPSQPGAPTLASHHSSQLVAAAARGLRAPKHGWRGREAGEGTVWRVLALVRGRRGARGSRAGVVRQSRGFASRMLAHADTESWRLAARECDASVSVRVSLGRPISSPAATRLTSMSEP